MNPPIEVIANAVEQLESGGRWWAVSRSGCVGVMQICPRWVDVPRDQLLIPEVNRREGIKLLRYWHSKAHGDWWATLAGYRCGWKGLRGQCGKTYANKVMSLARKMRRVTKEKV